MLEQIADFIAICFTYKNSRFNLTACRTMNGSYAVIVQHGNYRTVYSQLKKIYVKQGDKLTAKQAIGQILTDENEDNKTELYFQIYKDRSILNPSLWLAQ